VGKLEGLEAAAEGVEEDEAGSVNLDVVSVNDNMTG